MPKTIDHEEKKRQIAEAAWRVMLQQGLEGATVRNISKEAEISLGALRYYFPTQMDLLEYAYSSLQEKITEAVSGIFQLEMSPKEKILKVLFFLLPDDEGIRPEIEVSLIFKNHPEFRNKNFKRKEEGVYTAVKNVVSNLMLLNLLRRDVDSAIETDRLYALMDGLAMNARVQNDKWDIEQLRKLVLVHLDSICHEKFSETDI